MLFGVLSVLVLTGIVMLTCCRNQGFIRLRSGRTLLSNMEVPVISQPEQMPQICRFTDQADSTMPSLGNSSLPHGLSTVNPRDLSTWQHNNGGHYQYNDSPSCQIPSSQPSTGFPRQDIHAQSSLELSQRQDNNLLDLVSSKETAPHCHRESEVYNPNTCNTSANSETLLLSFQEAVV